VQVVGYEALIRDLRHLDARAASDLADWLAYLMVKGLADRSLYLYTRRVAFLLRAHPDLTVDEYEAAHVNAVLADRPQRSRFQIRKAMQQWFDWLEDEERITRNPMRRVPKMRRPPRRPIDIFTDVEIALLESLPMPDGPLLTLMFTTGMRRSECRRLRRDHIDLNRARLVVYGGKGGKDRVILLTPSALNAVADLDLLERLRPTDYLWYTTFGNGRYRRRRHPIGDTTFDRWWKRVLAAAEVRYLNPHQTRHTYGWMLRSRGWDLEERMLAMGHESPETTQLYYGRLSIEDLVAKVAELG
jgi:integrase/recombinase XerD